MEAETAKVEQKVREEQLKKESVIRKRVQALIYKVGGELKVTSRYQISKTLFYCLLQAISSLAQGSPSAVHNYIPDFFEILLSSLPLTLIQTDTINALRSLSRCLQSVLLPISDYLCYALVNLFAYPVHS